MGNGKKMRGEMKGKEKSKGEAGKVGMGNGED